MVSVVRTLLLDVEPVAVEIAKLRIWLKIIEGNGWKIDYGKLPNIDLNIEVENSLIGLPLNDKLKKLSIKEENINKLAEMRMNYKNNGGENKEEIIDFLENVIRPVADKDFLYSLDYTEPISLMSIDEL